MDEQKQLIRSQVETIRDLKAKISTYEEQLKTKETTISTLQREIEEQKVKLVEFAAKVLAVKTVFEEQEKQAENDKKELADAALSLDTAKLDLQQKQLQIEDLQQAALETSGVINNLNAKILQLQDEKKELTSKLESAEDDLLIQVRITQGIAERTRNTGRVKREREEDGSQVTIKTEGSPAKRQKVIATTNEAVVDLVSDDDELSTLPNTPESLAGSECQESAD